MKKKQKCIKIDDYLIEEIENLAIIEKRSFGSMVRILLDEALRQRQPGASHREPPPA